MTNFINSWQDFSIAFFLVLVWSIAWKGLALWRAAERKHKIWFVAILIINTVGILEVLYYFFFSNDQVIKKIKDLVSGKKPTGPAGTIN